MVYGSGSRRTLLLAVTVALQLVTTNSQHLSLPSRGLDPAEGALNARADTRVDPCKPYLPSKVLRVDALSDRDDTLKGALSQVDQLISKALSSQDTIDSVTIGIISANQTIWSKGYGRRNANSTDTTPPDDNTIYRLASLSKLFATFEGFILRDQGVINWFVGFASIVNLSDSCL